MQSNQDNDVKVVEQATPFIRSICAFALFLRYGHVKPPKECYAKADIFINQLKSDLKESK